VIAFDAAHKAVHYPEDRRFRIWIRPAIVRGIVIAIVVPFAIAWLQYALAGLPQVAPIPLYNSASPGGSHGFPLPIRYTHFFNFLFLTMLIRSGISILMDHPRLYFNDDCTPGSEWIRFTPIQVPKDRLWTAKDDARYISPLVATPGYRHTIGVARSWHFIDVYGFLITGAVFLTALFTSDQWRRLVPTSTTVLLQAWNTFVYYATLHFPPEPNGFYGYNALQQLAYFAVVFVFAPLSIFTGASMSPALVNRFPWFTKPFGGRQGARSLHFILMNTYFAFLHVHVTLVVLTGFRRNMNHIVMGTDDLRPDGMIWGFVGIAAVLFYWVGSHYVSWYFPRMLQHAQKAISQPLRLTLLNPLQPVQHYTDADISPQMWPNGKIPTRDDWKQMAQKSFDDFTLKVGGLVENPAELSLADMAALGKAEFTTMHHCIQGWSGIAKWGGLPMSKLIALVRPRPEARTAVFYSFGEALFGGPYYDTQRFENLLKPGSMLAYEMNGAPLSALYGAPVRLRVENQLGYKMVKWIERIDFIESETQVGEGEGGKNEDDEYFDLLPNI
jgi:DMSO/TMAO reductase YedYZ molybdopterin-dependent catalytic subunit/thiosulfate reductase cytochrome b subunit